MFTGYPTMMFQEMQNPGILADPNYPAVMMRRQQMIPEPQFVPGPAVRNVVMNPSHQMMQQRHSMMPPNLMPVDDFRMSNSHLMQPQPDGQQFRVVYQPMLVRVGQDGGEAWPMVDDGPRPDVVGDYRLEEVRVVLVLRYLMYRKNY